MAKVSVMLYASFREVAGTGVLPEEADDLEALFEALASRFGPTFAKLLEGEDRFVVLVNGRNALRKGTVLRDGDEVAIFPPVSGG